MVEDRRLQRDLEQAIEAMAPRYSPAVERADFPRTVIRQCGEVVVRNMRNLVSEPVSIEKNMLKNTHMDEALQTVFNLEVHAPLSLELDHFGGLYDGAQRISLLHGHQSIIVCILDFANIEVNQVLG